MIDEVSALVDRLAAAADAQTRAALQSLSDDHRATLAALHRQLEQRARENQELHALLATAQGDLEAAQGEVDRAATQFESVLEELRQEHLTTMREQAVACTTLPLDQLQSIFSALGKAATVPEVLTALVTGLSREFSRVALFSLQGNRLQGVQHIGFDLKSDISKVAIPTSVDSLLTRAISSGAIESFIAGSRAEPCTTPFGGAPSCALALPVVVNGQTLAVIYADDSDQMEFAVVPPQLLAKFAELLLQHTLLVLVRAGTDQKRDAELKAYATMLLDEMEYGYGADAEAGYTESECRRRLSEALECSRRIFAGRTAGEGPEAAAILDQKLAATVEARNGTRFGRDLAGVAREVAKAASASALANCG